MRVMKILGHRGCMPADNSIYQNSIPAFEVGAGQDGFETDIVKSAAPERIFCVHDTRFVTQVENHFPHHVHPDDHDKIGDKRPDELSSKVMVTLALNHPSKPKIPTFENLVEIHNDFPEAILNLELKGADTAKITFDHLEALRINPKSVIVSSFNHPELLKFRGLAGDKYKIGALMALPFQEKNRMHPWDEAHSFDLGFYVPLREAYMDDPILEALQPDFFNIGQRASTAEDSAQYDDVSAEKIAMIKEHYPESDIIVWTLGEAHPNENKPLMDKVEDLARQDLLYAFITNYPREVKAEMKKRGVIPSAI